MEGVHKLLCRGTKNGHCQGGRGGGKGEDLGTQELGNFVDSLAGAAMGSV